MMPQPLPPSTLDWRKHPTGKPAACVICGRPTILRNEVGKPCHKTCAERELAGPTA